MMLEFSQYLENYLWPNYKNGSASHAHMMSIVVMLNEKFRERVEVWQVFEKNKNEFTAFFQQLLESCISEPTADDLTSKSYMREQTSLLVFLNHCFNSMEVELCRDQAKKLVSLSMWSCLQSSKRSFYFFIFCWGSAPRGLFFYITTTICSNVRTFYQYFKSGVFFL